MPSSGSERQRKAGPCARRCARVPSVEPPSMTRNSYNPSSCERTEAIVAAIFVPLLKVGVMTDISGGFMTNQGRGGGSTGAQMTATFIVLLGPQKSGQVRKLVQMLKY